MNTHRTSLSFVLLACAILLPLTARGLAQAPPAGSGTVAVSGPARAIEGDTLEVIIGGRRVGVGIVGIVSPAGNTACGRQAIQFVRSLVQQRLELREDPGAPAFDAPPVYRRMYRVLRMPSGTSVAIAMASAGFANADPRAQQAVEYAQIVAAAADARANGRGCAR